MAVRARTDPKKIPERDSQRGAMSGVWRLIEDLKKLSEDLTFDDLEISGELDLGSGEDIVIVNSSSKTG